MFKQILHTCDKLGISAAQENTSRRNFTHVAHSFQNVEFWSDGFALATSSLKNVYFYTFEPSM